MDAPEGGGHGELLGRRIVKVMHILSVCLVLGLMSTIASASGTVYYVSSSGDDRDAGTSPTNAWRTLARVNQQRLVRGDSVLLRGGEVFPGTIELNPPEGGTATEPITFGTYGKGRATISAGTSYGFDIEDVAGVRIRNLEVVGSGVDTNQEIGIAFFVDLRNDVKLPWIRIENVHVTGFRRGGISIGAWKGDSGFEDVRVVNSRLDYNGNNGMAVWGFYEENTSQTVDDYPHRSIYIGHNVFASNWGDPSRTTQHTGSGVVVSQASNVLIERNVAYDNGRSNTYTGGGPVGIWMWDVLNGVIQYNESALNMSATLDGGGFDLDGGAVSCVMQYNYSHDNQGPGFMVAEFQNAPAMRNVTVRYNISERDGGRGNAGALQLWNGDSGGPPIDLPQFYNNTVYVAPKSLGTTKAFRVFGPSGYHRSMFSNNIFLSDGWNSWLGEVSTGSPPHFAGNSYFAMSGAFVIRQGGSYASLTAWRNGTGQEFLSGSPTGFQLDPGLVAPGEGGSIGDADNLDQLNAYQLLPTSAANNLGLPLSLYGISVGLRDFYGDPVPSGSTYSLGAHDGR